MRILTTDEVREAEREAAGRPNMSTLVLMQRAGSAVAQFCLAHFKFDSVCVVCGKGNNGGKGMAAAEALRSAAAKISVIVLARDQSELSPDAAAMCARLSLPPIWIADAAAFDSDVLREALAADLILDAVLGAGFKAPLRGLAQKAVEAINDAFGTVVSVDVPSGLDADLVRELAPGKENIVFAHGIISFIAPRPAHVFGDLTTGPIAVSEIGVQPVAVSNNTGLQVATGQEVGITFPPRRRDAHKGSFGHVLVVAGSLGKAGAAGLAGLAALYTGAGLVTVACPKSIQATVSSSALELMTEGLEETSEGSIALQAMSRLEQLLGGKDAVVVGPGLSQNAETAECVRRLVTKIHQPLVLDADGLNAFDQHYGEFKSSGRGFLVLTPHPGEASRLVGISIKDIQSSRTETARCMARDTGACVVLKGWNTVVAGASGETWMNMSGNPAMAKGGSGDVLSGIIGAALAVREARESSQERPPASADLTPPKTWVQEIYGADPNEKLRKLQAQQLQRNSQVASAFLKDVAVAAAVHLHGLAGDFARDMLHEHTVLASHVIKYLPEAFRDCEEQLEQDLFYLQK
jgi:ADP-dependent NAD(P)H-hydrate dehydratase / NAD(P)H-hydrate epimerase